MRCGVVLCACARIRVRAWPCVFVHARARVHARVCGFTVWFWLTGLLDRWLASRQLPLRLEPPSYPIHPLAPSVLR